MNLFRELSNSQTPHGITCRILEGGRNESKPNKTLNNSSSACMCAIMKNTKLKLTLFKYVTPSNVAAEMTPSARASLCKGEAWMPTTTNERSGMSLTNRIIVRSVQLGWDNEVQEPYPCSTFARYIYASPCATLPTSINYAQ